MSMDLETRYKGNRTEEEEFQNATEIFFRMNPSNRFWILLALYFARERELHVIDNYKGHDGGMVMASMSISLINHANIVREWEQQNIQSRSVVAYIPVEQKELFNEIYNISVVDKFHSFASENRQSIILGDKTQMEPTYLVEIAESLIGLSDEWYLNRGAQAFDILLKRCLNANWERKGSYYQPVEIAKLIVDILDAKCGTVYDPFAGVCSIGALLNTDCLYYGQESSNASLLGKLNLLFNGKSNSVCEQASSLSEWKGADGFDYIVGIPPFGVRCHGPFRTTDREFFYKSAHEARHKAIGVYPSNICFCGQNSINSPMMEELIEKDYIEGVILLPGGIFSTTVIESVLIIVNKQKSKKNYIRFVDASDLYIRSGRGYTLLYNRVLDLYLWGKKNARNVHVSEIQASGNILYPKYYLVRDIFVPEGMKAIALRDVLTYMEPKRSKSIQARIFSDKASLINADGIIKSENLKYGTINEMHFASLNEDCLVIGRVMRFTAKYLVTNGEEVCYRRPTHLAFRVDTKVVDPRYLLAEMSKEYFLDQLSRFGSFTSSYILSRENFLCLKILVPLDKEQQTKLSLDSIEKNLEEIENRKATEYMDRMQSFVVNQRQRKHAVSQVLNEILPSVENIEDYILEHDVVTKDTVISHKFGTTLEGYLTSIHKQLDKVIAMVDNFTSKEVYGEPESIQLNKFLSEYCKSKRALDINVVYIPQQGDEKIIRKAKISKADLEQMLNNLIFNAVKYGGGDEIEQKYGSSDGARRDLQIRIELSDLPDNIDCVAIKVSNNGEPVSRSISLDKLFVWGIGKGTGIGCWQVKDIAEHFGGTVTYNEYGDDPEGFVCEFSIVLPLIED